jgi:hypothetical protein
MAEYTLTYSDGFQGFPSFYSYIPDFMIGMNNYFYTFKNGDLYRHNTNENRNVFYGVTDPLPNDPYKGAKSRITSVFNDQPLENKLFKTINLESSFVSQDHAWDGIFDTDVQDTGFIDYEWFEKKEGAWFAFIRNEGNVPSLSKDYPLRSLNGIGDCSTVLFGGIGSPSTVNFPVTIDIGSILSIGDQLYATTTPTLIGEVTGININLPSGINSVTVSITVNEPFANDFIFFIKNQVAESYGVLGHYCEFTLTNEATDAVELFAVETEVMKSFP